MLIAVRADESKKTELLSTGLAESAQICWIQEDENLLDYPDADAYIDLLFEPLPGRIDMLKKLLPKPIIVNSVVMTLAQLPEGVIRINAWSTFLRRIVIEGSSGENKKEIAEKLLSCFNKKISWVPDMPGFVSPRVISMIINEAYFALEDKVSTRKEIDIAMKLGTNYPYGPFEWGALIGSRNIVSLLETLSIKDDRYQPAALLKQETIL